MTKKLEFDGQNLTIDAENTTFTTEYAYPRRLSSGEFRLITGRTVDITNTEWEWVSGPLPGEGEGEAFIHVRHHDGVSAQYASYAYYAPSLTVAWTGGSVTSLPDAPALTPDVTRMSLTPESASVGRGITARPGRWIMAGDNIFDTANAHLHLTRRLTGSHSFPERNTDASVEDVVTIGSAPDNTDVLFGAARITFDWSEGDPAFQNRTFFMGGTTVLVLRSGLFTDNSSGTQLRYLAGAVGLDLELVGSAVRLTRRQWCNRRRAAPGTAPRTLDGFTVNYTVFTGTWS